MSEPYQQAKTLFESLDQQAVVDELKLPDTVKAPPKLIDLILELGESWMNDIELNDFTQEEIKAAEFAVGELLSVCQSATAILGLYQHATIDEHMHSRLITSISAFYLFRKQEDPLVTLKYQSAMTHLKQIKQGTISQTDAGNILINAKPKRLG